MPCVTDTHALIWHLTANSNLSVAAKHEFIKVESAPAGTERIVIPCIIFFELVYLIEKKKVAVDFAQFVSSVETSANYRVEPMCIPIIKQAMQISRDHLPDPWDRIIAATAMHLGLPLITRDRKIGNLGIPVIW